jgi:CheY-like chemotaxis protein
MTEHADANLWKAAVSFLIVDDEDHIRHLVTTFLKKEGFTGPIYEATDGACALEVFGQKEVNCIICDWHMPQLNGVEFIGKVRRGYVNKHPAIMMVTGYASLLDNEEFLKLGVDEYLLKPFTSSDFKQKLEKLQERLKDHAGA